MGKNCRNWSQIYSKWRTTNRKAMDFNDIYANVARITPSGTNNVDQITITQELFKNTNKQPFTQTVFGKP